VKAATQGGGDVETRDPAIEASGAIHEAELETTGRFPSR
jgi:hypothetical protein